MSLEFKQKGNDCFTRGDFSEALCFYSKVLVVPPKKFRSFNLLQGNNYIFYHPQCRSIGQALRHAPTSSDDADKTLLSTVYTNRASSLLVGLLISASIILCCILYVDCSARNLFGVLDSQAIFPKLA